jgi:hypothetical protein
MALSKNSLVFNFSIANQAAAVASTLDISNYAGNGCTIVIQFNPNSVAGGLQNITLPSPVNLFGCNIIVVCNTARAGGNVNSSCVLTAPAALIYYSLALGNAALTRTVAPSATLRFDRSVAAVVGDYIILQSNGVCWEAQGFAGTAAAITV